MLVLRDDTEPVGHNNSVADLVSQLRGDVSAQNRVKQVVKLSAGCEGQALTPRNLYRLK